MDKFRCGTDRRQVALLPATIEDYLPAEDIVRYVDVLIDSLDLSLIESQYCSFGRPAFHPKILIKILLYGKMRGIRSSRQLAQACRENLRFIFLAQNEKPDFRTLILFRSRFLTPLAGLLKQTIAIGLQEGLITLDHVCIDGTKLRAFAGRNSFKDPKKLEQMLSLLEEEVCRSLQQDVQLDEAEDQQHGKDDDSEPKLPKDLRAKQALCEKLKKALHHYYQASEGAQPDRISTTDPECRYMKSKGTLPSYNAQAAVDRDSTLVVGGFITNAVCDNGQLSSVLASVEENTGKNPDQVSSDKGYGAQEGLADLKRRDIKGYIGQREEPRGYFSLRDFHYSKEKDAYRCPNGHWLEFVRENKTRRFNQKNKARYKYYEARDCGDCPLRIQCLKKPSARHRTLSVSEHVGLMEGMRKRMATRKGKQMAKIRGATVEPLFGRLKYAKGLHQVLCRGFKKVDAMWRLELAAVNMEKLAHYFRQRGLSPTPA